MTQGALISQRWLHWSLVYQYLKLRKSSYNIIIDIQTIEIGQ